MSPANLIFLDQILELQPEARDELAHLILVGSPTESAEASAAEAEWRAEMQTRFDADVDRQAQLSDGEEWITDVRDALKQKRKDRGVNQEISVLARGIFCQFLAFPREEREELLHYIVSYLGPLTEEEAKVEAEWQLELQRRLDSVADGTAQLLDWDDSVARIRRALKGKREL